MCLLICFTNRCIFVSYRFPFIYLCSKICIDKQFIHRLGFKKNKYEDCTSVRRHRCMRIAFNPIRHGGGEGGTLGSDVTPVLILELFDKFLKSKRLNS